MNKIFKTKYDVTTGQTKVVSELANNRQVASRVEGASVGVGQPKCGVFLGMFKVLPLALLMSGLLSSAAYGANVWIDVNPNGITGGDNKPSSVWYNGGLSDNKNEVVLLADGESTTGAKAQYKNKDFKRTVIIGSRAVGGGNDATAIGYRAIVGKNLAETNTDDSHQGTAVGYRAFSYGNESVSLGNDTVAYGESSISIGSDNVGRNIGKYSRTGLSYDIWKLYRQNGSKFNYTGEYAAIDGADPDTSRSKYEAYLSETNPTKPFYRTHNWAFGDSSIAIGSRNVAYGHGSLAMGTLSVAKGDYSTALGTATLAFGNSSVALGNESYVYAGNSIGVGNEVQAISDGSMVYGYQSYAGGPGSIAIGKRALSNVEPSAHFKQTVEDFGNLWYEGKSTVHALGMLDNPQNHGKSKDLDGYFLPATEKQSGTEEEKAKGKNGGAVALGYYVYALGENSVALGRQAYSKGDRSIAIGPYAYGGYEKTIAMGYGAKAMSSQSLALGSLSRVEGKNSVALGVEAKVLNDESNSELNGQNSMALGNNSEVTMKNSVAIGNMSNTRYYYTGDKSNPTPSSNNNNNNNNNAITLPAYIPKGTSYSYTSTSDDGVISVGGWDRRDGKLGRRRIINVAPGALDSDAATVGQLKALEYAYKEGVVAYYTVEGGKNYKVVKDADGKFYKANTENGTPLDSTAIAADKVFVGPKGANERSQSIQVNGRRRNVVDMGDKIKFAHISDGEITSGSDQAITGNQLNQLGSTILGLGVQSNDKTKFDTPSFTKVQYEGSTGTQNHTTFKNAIDESIKAINKGLVIQGDDKQGKISLGSTLNIKAGNTSVTDQGTKTEYKSDNIRTAYQPKNKTLLIGIKENPTFKSVTVSDPITASSPEGTLTTKKYVDDQLKNVSTNLHFLSVQGTDKTAGNYNNDGAKASYSVAIGVNAQVVDPTIVVTGNKPKPTATAGIAIGYNAKSEAENAVAIGRDVSIDVPNSFVMGSNNTVTQSFKETNGAVVVIGSGTKLVESKSSIAIGAVYKVHQGKADGTLIENAAWTASIGNKNKIKNGTDIVALGNNIEVKDETNEENPKNKTRIANNDLILIGNGATAETAKNSVLVGAKSNAGKGAKNAVIIGHSAEAKAEAEGAVVIGQGANVQTKATGAIAFGQSATVNAEASNAIAFGKSASVQPNATSGIAFGQSASVSVADGIALGSHSVASTAGDKVGFNTVTGATKADPVSHGAWKSKYGALSIGGNNNGTRQITGVAAGTNDTDAVNVAQLKEATLHFVSVNGGSKTDENYTNNGATKTGAIALGIGAKAASENSIAMGKDSKIEAEISNAVAIGANNHLRGLRGKDNKDQYKHTVAIGSDNIITGRKIVNLGSGNKIGNAEDSYQTDKKAGAVSIRVIGDDNKVHGVWNTVIGEENKLESSNWTQVIGDYNAVTKSDYAIVISSNQAQKGDQQKTTNTVTNSNYAIVIGNQAKATDAKNSVVIGASANSTAESAVVLGKGATVQANATGAVAIGEGASVSTNAGESIALGKGSKATQKENTVSTYTATQTSNIKFNGFSGSGNDKSVLSIGDGGKERVIKHVAPGKISNDSTDAINGSQLYSVIDVFGHLGATVLGAEVDATKGFKQSTFENVKYKDGGRDQKNTFKAAIDETIKAINKGIVISDGSETGTRQLGETLTVKAGNIDKPQTDSDGFSSNNIKTKYLKDNGEILIGIKDKPEFKEVTVSQELTDTSKDNVLTTKKYVDNKLANVASKFTVSGNEGSQFEINKDNNKLSIKGETTNNNIKTKATSSKEIEISLSDTLTGITSIGKNSDNGITFNTNATTIKLGGVSLSLNKDNTAVKISGVADGKDTNDAVNKGQLDKKQDKLTGTITANNGIKLTGTAANSIASDITLSLEDGLKEKIDNALSKADAGNTYAKVDASNIENGNKASWRTTLDVYSKTEANAEIAKAKETVTNGDGITVSATPDGTDGPKTFTVALADEYKTKINSIGTGSVADNDKNTVTGGKVHTAIEDAKTTLTSTINGKADKNLSNIDETGKAKIKTLATEAIDVQGKEGELKVTPSTSGNKKSFTVSLNDDIKTKIDGIGTGTVVADNNKTVTGGAVHTAIEAAKTDLKGKLYANTATFGLKGNDSQEVTKKLDNTIEIKGTDTAKSGQTNIYVSKADENGLKIELGENLKGIKKISQGEKAVISLEDKALTLTSNNNKVAVKSDHVLSDKDIYIGTKTDDNKLVKKSELGGGYITFEDENTSKGTKNVNFGKKVIYGKSAEITPTVEASIDDAKVTFAINDASIEGTKLKDATIAEAKLDQGIKTKLNKTFKVKAGDESSDNLIGEELEFATKDANLTVGLDATKKKITYGLSSALTGIESIGKDNNTKITFKNNGQNEIDFTVGTNTTYKFTDSGLDLASKPITNLGSGLEQKTGNGGRQDLDEFLKLTATNGQPSDGKLNKAINAGDLLHVAQGLVGKGLKFKADSASADGSTKTEMTIALGQAVTFKGDGKYLTTKLNDTNGEISFNLSVAESISDASTDGDSTQNTSNSKLVTENAVKNFVTNKINNLSSTLQLEGDNTENDKDPADPIGKVELKTEKLKLTGENDFIETEVKANDPTVTIKLAQKVKDKLAIIKVGENTNGDNSFALGKDSKLETKKTAPTGITQNVGGNDVTITWSNAGAGQNKEVVSVGDTGKERIITHVAAGDVRDGSTDAVNGGQLHRVIDVFGKLGLDVLGAEKADSGDGFKKSKFDVVKTSDNTTDSNPEKSEKTFKTAIEDNIAAINKGLKFAGDNDGEKQLYLGSTLNIKGAKGEASSAGSNSASSDTTNNHQNIFTKASDTGLEIALNEALQGISSISGKKGTDGSAVAKIDFTSSGTSTSPTVKITADGGEFTFGKDGLNLNSKQITGIASGLGLKDSVDGNNGGSAGTSNSDTDIINKVLSGNPDKDNNNAVNVKDLSKVANALVEKGLSFEGNGGNTDKVTRKLGDTLKIVGKGSDANSITATENNIKVSKNTTNDGLEIGLSETLAGIKSIANGDKAKIALDNDKKTITFTAGETNNNVTLSEGEFSGVSEINKADGKGALKLADSTATLESASGNSNVALKANEATVTAGTDKGSLKLEAAKATLESAKNGSNVALDGTSATLSAGNGKGSIKVATGSGDDANKIELSPENGSAVTLAKDGTNGVKATGLSTVGLDGDNALVFTNGAGNKAELKVGGSALTFTKATTGNTVKISNVAVGKIESSSSEAITGGQLHDLATHLGVAVDNSGKTTFTAPSFAKINGSEAPKTFKGAIDNLITAVNGGLTFRGNDNSSSPSSTTLQLGRTLTIDSSESKTKLENSKATKEKDITTKLEPSNGSDSQAGTLTLTLNKATSVDENDERVVTSSAVANKLKNYTTTETLEDDFLRVTGENINGHQKEFGKNVGLEEVKLEEDETEGTSELVQAKALVDYLKGTGEKSVKLSDSAKTQAIGEGSISIGHNAVSRNEGSIAMGYNSEASNSGAISIGQGSTVLGTSSVAVGKENDVKGNFSFVLGESNTLDKEQTYVIGSDNTISGAKNIAIGLGNTVGGNENIVLGSHVDLKDDVEGAIVLGDKSIGVSNAVSVGNALTKRRIVFVDTPQGEYDAVNKKYVDGLTLSYKENSTGPAKSINLKTGALDFVKSENISVAVEADGKITHTLNNNLTSIVSISGGKNGSEDAAKITLSSKPETEEEAKDYVKTVTINDAKLKGLLDGEIAESSKEAVTGKQLADLTKQLGVDVSTSDKTKFTAPIFEYLSKVDGSFNKNPTTLKGAIDEARAKLNEGLKFGGDIPSAGTNTNNTHYLGSTINIVRLGTPTGTGAVAPTSTDGYSGSNLITQYTNDKGNAKIEIGFKDAPTFSKVTLSQEQKYGEADKVGSNDLITKSYLEGALSNFKFNVEYGDKKVQIGRGDTLKFADGLNIQGSLKQEGATQPSVVTSTTAPTTVNTPSGSENGGAGTTVVSNGADSSNSGSSDSTSNMASSGGTNGASSDSADTAVASSSPTAGTSSTPTTTPTTTTSTTTAVVTIGTKNDLTNITSISSKAGSADGNDADNGTTGDVTKLSLTPENATFQVGTTGSKVKIDKEGISLTPQATDPKDPSANAPSITINVGSVPATPNTSSPAQPADPSLPAVDNGPSIAFAAKGGSNGSKEGTGTIKYLKDRTVKNTQSMNDKDKYGEGDNKGNAATEGAVKELYDSGLKFAGNDNVEVAKKIGDKLAIVGQGLTKDKVATFKGTDGNIAVTAKPNSGSDANSKLEISLSESLKDMNSFETKAKKVTGGKDDLYAKSKLDGEGLHLTPFAGISEQDVIGPLTDKAAHYGLLGSTVKDGDKTNTQTAGESKLTQDGNTNVSTATETKLTSKDGETASLTAKGLTVGDSTKDGDKTHAVYGKTGFSVKGKDGSSEIVSLKVANGQDGNAQSATLAFAKGTDSKSGTGTIKGLADIKPDETDGSLAANKNYVDEKVSDLDSNRPFDFYVKEGEKEIKVVKGRDGKFYKPEDLKGAKYVAGTADGDKGKYTKNGQDVKSSIADKQAAVVIKAEPTTSPMTITNVKDGDLTNTSTDAINGGQLVKATGAKFIDDPNSSETAPKPKIMVFADGRDGKSGLEAEAMATKGLTGKDGLNGKNANDKANALRDGEAGTVVFTDRQGNRLVKANDGKYYEAGDVEADGKLKQGASAVEKLQLSLVNHEGEATKPVALGNVASGLELPAPETDPAKAKEAKEKTAQLANAVKDKKAEVSDKAKTLSDKAKTFTRLTLAVNGLEQAANALPDGKAKAQIEAQLKETQEELAKAQKALETAKTDLQTAQENLKTANADYEANYEGYAKVADLVSADSKANVANVATVGDLQAVAKSGMKFKGNDGVEVRKQLSETLSIIGEGTFNSNRTAAGNIKVEMAQDGKGLEVKLSDQLKNMTSFETREVNGKKARLDSNGLRVVNKGKDGTDDKAKSATYGAEAVVLEDKNKSDKAVMTAGGIRFADSSTQATALSTELNKNGLTVNGAGGQIHIDGTKGVITVPNIKPNADGHVVVNKNYVDTKNNELRTQMNNNDRNMRAGVAQAVAQANLPINILPGKSTLSLATGNYMGTQAFAVGYSRVSDNGKLSVKFSLGHGDKKTSVGAGVGYSW
uniref:Autotransporter adhesin n=2 Tax=Pasteurellaceae TaxID=712 RepID=Q0I1T5_HISS1